MEQDTIASIEREYAQKIDAARVAIQETSDSAFIEIPFYVAGVPIRSMRLPDFLALIAAGNAHITGDAPSDSEDFDSYWAVHNAQLLWALSPSFKPDPDLRSAFMARIAALPFDKVCEDLNDYLRETFADAPRAVKTAQEGARSGNPIRVSFAAIWIFRIASRLHWSRAEILGAPLKEIFQLLRVIDAADSIAAGKEPARLTDEVDRLWAEMLVKINSLNAAPIE